MKHKIFFGILNVILLWVILMAFLPLYAPKILYWIESPVIVKHVSQSFVTLRFTRFSRFAMKATFINELRCQQFYPYPEADTLLGRGESTFTAALPIPEGAKGPCTYTAMITYRPFGIFGPPVNVFWESEPFDLMSSQPRPGGSR